MRSRIFIVAVACFGFAIAAAAGTRVKDLTMIAGARDNQLVGYGLVAGLAGEGDKNLAFTVQSIAKGLGLKITFSVASAA